MLLIVSDNHKNLTAYPTNRFILNKDMKFDYFIGEDPGGSPRYSPYKFDLGMFKKTKSKRYDTIISIDYYNWSKTGASHIFKGFVKSGFIKEFLDLYLSDKIDPKTKKFCELYSKKSLEKAKIFLKKLFPDYEIDTYRINWLEPRSYSIYAEVIIRSKLSSKITFDLDINSNLCLLLEPLEKYYRTDIFFLSDIVLKEGFPETLLKTIKFLVNESRRFYDKY
ncbi:MAG: hypothetical protein QW350_04135 [Candidatus Aenigmatarchaeota archaeon]